MVCFTEVLQPQRDILHLVLYLRECLSVAISGSVPNLSSFRHLWRQAGCPDDNHHLFLTTEKKNWNTVWVLCRNSFCTLIEQHNMWSFRGCRRMVSLIAYILSILDFHIWHMSWLSPRLSVNIEEYLVRDWPLIIWGRGPDVCEQLFSATPIFFWGPWMNPAKKQWILICTSLVHALRKLQMSFDTPHKWLMFHP